jgi:cephalosporin hydroxylase/glycosyltransferase involved in cell wall biosynthesis
MKNILWVTAGQINFDESGYHSSLASARYRIIAPALALEPFGFDSGVLNENSVSNNHDILNQLKPGTIVVLSKIFRRETVLWARAAKQKGCLIVADFCDNLFSIKDRFMLAHEMVSCADLIIVSSEELRKVFLGHGVVVDAVIPDAVEFEKGLPRFDPKKELQVLWFGHSVNHLSVAKSIQGLKRISDNFPLSLKIVSNNVACWASIVSQQKPSFSVRFFEWQLNTIQDHMRQCDLVWLPTEMDDFSRVKSANRLIESLWAGRFVVAGPLPSYQEFSDVAWIGDDYESGIIWAIENPDLVISRIKAAQSLIGGRYTIGVLAHEWRKIFQSLAERQQVHPRQIMSSEVQMDRISQNEVCENYLKWFYDAHIWKQMSWCGVRTLKLPQDMWNYQEIIFEKKIDWVVETGSRHGGSALFFSQILKARNAAGFVISIDIDSSALQVEEGEGIRFLSGDSASPEMVAKVEQLIGNLRGRVFLILDSDHTFDHVLKELQVWVPFLRSGDYLVVEDTVINGHPVRPDFGAGPFEAVQTFIANNPNLLTNDVERESKFGVTFAKKGYYIRL